jgi:adenosylmethionine-8-amino-7-oxononanoate aminotransferase
MAGYLASDPIVITEGKGVRLKDSDGKWYYDGVSSIWLNVHGHRVFELDQAIRDQLDKLAHSTLLGQANEPSVLLAKELVKIAPKGLKRVFYSDSGATAVEIGLKMAIQYWRNQGIERTKILGFGGNYHGDTFGAMSVAPDDLFHWPFLDLLPKHPRAPYPYCYRCPVSLSYPGCQLACLDLVQSEIEKNKDQIAAIIVEPVEGAGGMIPAPPGYLRSLRQLADSFGILLIVDEVATGFGRTGSMFACDSEGVSPDILCLAKGISGGYLPIAATLATEEVFSKFLGRVEERKTLFHGHSYTGNALAAAVSLANLRLFEELLPSLDSRIKVIEESMARIKEIDHVGDVRQRGFMVGIELVKDVGTKERFAYEQQLGWKVARIARTMGLLVRPLGSVVVFMPPLASTEDELREMCSILDKSLQRVQDELR